MVNFHAVALYAKARGGEAFLTPYLDGFKVSMPLPEQLHEAATVVGNFLCSLIVVPPWRWQCAGFVFGAGMERLKDLNFAWQVRAVAVSLLPLGLALHCRHCLLLLALLP